jgi:cytochrome P450
VSADAMSVQDAQQILYTAEGYIDEDRWHQAAALLRKEAPISWVEGPGITPFWALTKHKDILEVELHNNEFLSEPRCIMGTAESDAKLKTDGHLVKSLVQMDDPEHRLHRNVTSEWFLPKNLAKLEGRLDELADEALQKMRDFGGECDFAAQIAMQYPLQVILAILGLPESDYGTLLRLTQEMFAPDDSDFKRDEDAMAGLMQTLFDLYTYFTNLTADRRANPTSDLASVIANAQIEGNPMGDMETIGYYIIAATAGHDTTSNAMAGAMKALIDHPDQLARLQADPSLMGTAVDEMIRWTSPVKQFMRTAAVDYELGGQTIKAGEDVYLAYWSANRDEDVFENPFTFDVGRSPNKHLAFGFGVHYCLGAMLARMEMKAVFSKILPHLASVEYAGESALTKSGFVSGVKRLPIRYTLR